MGTSKRNTTSAAPKALSAKDVAAFLDSGDVPVRKAQCVGRIFIVLLSGAGLCLIRERSLLWAVPVGLLCLFGTAACIVLMVRFSRLRISLYLCDGIFGLCIAVIMNLGAYLCTVVQAGSSVLRLIAMMGLLLIWAAAFAAITVSWIRAGKFSNTNPSKPNFWLPGLCGVVGRRAVIDDSLIGKREGLIVKSIKYSLGKNGESTTVVLGKENGDVADELHN